MGSYVSTERRYDVCRFWLTAIVMVFFAPTGPLRGETRPTDEELFRAVRLGDLTALKGIVEQSPGLVNSRFRSGSSPLSYAVSANQTDVVKFLLEHEVDPNQPIGNDGETAIFNAVSAETVALLVKYGAEVSLETERYEVTPIRAAARRGDTEAARALMRAGARLDFASAVMLGWTDKVAEMLKKQPRLAATPSAMLWASVSHNRVDVWRLLLTCGADPNEDFDVANVGGPHTPVTCAVSSGDFAATKLLLEHGGDPNVCGGRNHAKLLLYATAYLDVRFLREMLARGADPNTCDDFHGNVTALHVATCLGGSRFALGYAKTWGQPPALPANRYDTFNRATVLIENGADVGAPTEDGASPLHFAALAGHEALSELLVKRGAKHDVYTASALGKQSLAEQIVKSNPDILSQSHHPLHRPPLHWAVQSGCTELVELLLDTGCDIDEDARFLAYSDALGFSTDADSNGETALHLAARLGDTAMVRLLLRRGAKINTEADHYFWEDITPLELACRKSHDEVVRLLLDAGAKFSLSKQSEVQEAAAENAEILRLLLTTKQVDLTGRTGGKLLRLAVAAKNEESIDILLRKGAPLDFHSACRLGKVDVVRELIANDPALINATEEHYPLETPVIIAIRNGHEETVRFLVEAGAPIDPVITKGRSPLHLAARYGHVSILKLLLAQGLVPNKNSWDRESLLHQAAQGAQPEMVQFLLQNDADVNDEDGEGNTPLHCLTGWWQSTDTDDQGELDRRQVAIAHLLIDAGANVNARNHRGRTPLHHAASEGFPHLAQILIDAGAKVNARTLRDETPLRLARSALPFGRQDLDTSPVIELLRRYGAKVVVTVD